MAGCLQYHDADSDRRLTDAALGLVAIQESRAVPVIVWYLCLLGTFSDAFRVPHSNRDKGCKPEDRVQDVEGEEGVGRGKSLGARPHGHHCEVDDGGYGQEALRATLSAFGLAHSTGQQRLTMMKKYLVPPPISPSLVITAMVRHAAIKTNMAWKQCATTLHFWIYDWGIRMVRGVWMCVRVRERSWCKLGEGVAVGVGGVVGGKGRK